MNLVTVYDCTGANLGTFPVPAGVLLMGYDTGSAGIAWTKQQYAAHPDAIHIDQDPAASDYTADVLDSERGAVPPGSPKIGEWYRKTLASWKAGTRPGQRLPAIYQSKSSITANVNALIAAGITSGPGLFVADWSIGDPAATAEVQHAAGPFPVIAVQWQNEPRFDVSIVSGAWLANRSKAATPPPPPVKPPAAFADQPGWRWCHLCGSLVYAPDSGHLSATHCPARNGGSHDVSTSGKYVLRMVAAG